MARYDIDIYANDRSGRALSNIEKQLNSINRRGRAVVGTLAGIATGTVARGIINQYRAYERYNTVLRTYLGSQERANDEMQRLQTLANSLPQDLDDITQAFTIFTRTGLDTSSKALTAFSNIATANGKSLTQLGEAVADALTGEFERLKEFGIKVSKENDKFVADIGNGQSIIADSSADLVRQLQALGEEGGKFGNAAANNADTLNQSFSNLQGAIFTTSVTIGKNLAPALKQAADLTATWLNSNQALIASLSTRVGEGLVTSVEIMSKALPIIADNIDSIRNAIFGLAVIKGFGATAQAFRQFGFVISDLRKNFGLFKTSATAAGTQMNWFGRSVAYTVNGFRNLNGNISGAIAGITRFGGSFAGLVARITGVSVAVRGLMALGPMLANPYVLAAAAIGAAIFGVFKYFEDESIKIAGLQTTVGETVRALWWKTTQVMKEYWADFTNFAGEIITDLTKWIVEKWQYIKEQAAYYIEPIASAWQWVVNNIGGYVKLLVDNVVGAFVFIGKSIWETVKQIPDMFVAVFSAIKTIVLDFASRIVTQFGNIGEAIKLAIEAPFTDATFADALAAATRNAFEGMGAVVSEEMAAIGNTLPDYGRLAGESFTGGYADAIGDGMKNAALRLQVAGQEVAAEAVSIWNNTKATVAEGVAIVAEGVRGVVEEYRAAQPIYDDAIMRMQRNGVVTIEAAAATTELAEAQETMADAVDNASSSIANQVNEIDDLAKEATTVSGIIKETWADMSEGMSRGIAESIVAGKGAFNSFKDYLKNFANEVLTRIIDRMLIQPMMNQMSNMFMGTNFQVPTIAQQFGGLGMGGGGGGFLSGLFGGGGGGFLSGLFGGIGNFFSGLWGGISNFFGGLFGGFFASGGYLPSGKVGIAGEAGPELISGPANITPLNNDMGGALTVNFNIQAIDTQSGTEFILQHKREIEGVIQNAYNRRGKEGIY